MVVTRGQVLVVASGPHWCLAGNYSLTAAIRCEGSSSTNRAAKSVLRAVIVA
jgi:hypothetical protein